MKVVHAAYNFGKVTENWIYNQVAGLQPPAVATCYCMERFGRDIFPFGNVRCVKEQAGALGCYVNRVCAALVHRYPQFARWLNEDRPDLIHAHFGNMGFELAGCAERLKVPLITSFYGYDAYRLPVERGWWKARYKTLFRLGTCFLVEGPAMRAKLIELGCPGEKVVVHHIGIRLGDYAFRPREQAGEVRLLAAGRFIEKKGFPFAIELVARLRKSSGRRITLTIVGDSDANGSLTAEKRKILRAIERFGLKDSVRMTGFVTQERLIQEIYEHHILLVPSVHTDDGDAEGGFPVVITEAMATGMPVMAFDHCDIPYVVKDGITGYIAKEKDIDALFDRSAYLIAHPELWVNMGGEARKTVERGYDISVTNKELADIYSRAVQA